MGWLAQNLAWCMIPTYPFFGMTKVYTEWLLAQDPNLPIRTAKGEHLSGWILGAVGEILEETIKNAWHKTGYSYYE